MTPKQIFSATEFVNDILDIIEADLQCPGLIVNDPWRQSASFPPVNISFHKETKAVKFEFALASYKKEEIDLDFNTDLGVMILTLTKEEVTEESPWVLSHGGLKKPSKYIAKYPVSYNRYDIQKTVSSFSEGMLTVEIPLREEAKPFKVTIS